MTWFESHDFLDSQDCRDWLLYEGDAILTELQLLQAIGEEMWAIALVALGDRWNQRRFCECDRQ